MNYTEQQITLIHTRLNVLLSLDDRRPNESKIFDSNKIELLEIILERGYYWALYEISHMFSPENGLQFLEIKGDVKEVFDILDMFRNHKELHGKFEGFDGNHDVHYGIHQFLIEILGRYKEVSSLAINSHGTVLPRYRELLEIYSTPPRNDP